MCNHNRREPIDHRVVYGQPLSPVRVIEVEANFALADNGGDWGAL